jgi:hypothetical protein
VAASAGVGNDSIEVYGVVLDEKGNPVVNANVTLTGPGGLLLLGNELTDFDGQFRIRIKKPKVRQGYIIKFQYLGISRTLTDLIMADPRVHVIARLWLGTLPTRGATLYPSGCSHYTFLDPEKPGGSTRIDAKRLQMANIR